MVIMLMSYIFINISGQDEEFEEVDLRKSKGLRKYEFPLIYVYIYIYVFEHTDFT